MLVYFVWASLNCWCNSFFVFKTLYMSKTEKLLLFTIGPVQDYIAVARTTRDLWSGSYLFSTLVSAAIKKLVAVANISEGDIIFPSVENQPLVALDYPKFDPSVFRVERDCSEYQEAHKFLTPTLPNRFLVVIPSNYGSDEEIQLLCEEAVSYTHLTLPTTSRV